MTQLIARTVGELRKLLDQLPEDAVPFSWEHPPFNGVKLVPQDSGAILIGPADSPRPKEMAASQGTRI